jgi:hypothetical protein
MAKRGGGGRLMAAAVKRRGHPPFQTYRDGNFEIYVMNADSAGGEATHQ